VPRVGGLQALSPWQGPYPEGAATSSRGSPAVAILCADRADRGRFRWASDDAPIFNQLGCVTHNICVTRQSPATAETATGRAASYAGGSGNRSALLSSSTRCGRLSAGRDVEPNEAALPPRGGVLSAARRYHAVTWLGARAAACRQAVDRHRQPATVLRRAGRRCPVGRRSHRQDDLPTAEDSTEQSESSKNPND